MSCDALIPSFYTLAGASQVSMVDEASRRLLVDRHFRRQEHHGAGMLLLFLDFLKIGWIPMYAFDK